MTRDETIALFERCEAARAKARAEALAAGKSEDKAENIAHEAAKAIWNYWAAEMLAHRKTLEEAGEWAEVARVDFSQVRFQCGVLAQSGNKSSQNSVAKLIMVEGEEICFSGFVFPGIGGFWRAQFFGDAVFLETQFSGDAVFEDAQFFGNADFGMAQFYRDANFFLAKFDQSASFAGAYFHGDAYFRAISGERSFSMGGVTFETVPNFIQAHFSEAPRLDDLTFGRSVEGGRFWRSLRRTAPATHGFFSPALAGSSDRSVNVNARYRALRRLAVQGHDHENERLFLRGEIRARRYILDKPWHAAFWFGIGYDVLSDFGSSIMRPVYWGLGSIIVFAGLYYAAVFAGCGQPPSQAIGEALYLSLKNAVLLISWDKAAEIPTASTCIESTMKGSIWSALALAAAQIAQKIWSAGLLFLFLLAVRNRFKIN